MFQYRVAIVSDTPYHADARLQRAVEAAASVGAHVTVIERGVDSERSREALAPEHNLESSFIPTAWLGRQIWHLSNRLTPLAAHRARLAWIEGRIVGASPDLIHCINPFGLEAAVAAAAQLNVPLVYEPYEYWPSHLFSQTYHLPVALAQHLAEAERAALPTVDGFITVSATMGAEYEELLNAPPATVIYNSGPDVPADLPAVQPTHTPLRLVHSGSAPRNRNVAHIVRALASVDAATLDIVGAGQDARPLVAAAEELDIACRVTARDRIDLSSLVAQLSQYDVGIIAHAPDTQHLDVTLPNKLFDYMAAGLAVVAVRTRSLSEIPGIEQFALLIDDASPVALTAGVRQLVVDPERVYAMKQAAHQAYGQFSRAQQLEKTATLYRDLLGSPPSEDAA